MEVKQRLAILHVIRHGRTLDGAFECPHGQDAPEEDGQGEEAEDGADGDEDGAGREFGFLHIGRVGCGRDLCRGDGV